MVVVLAGRRIDETGANYVRFPLRNLSVVRERLKTILMKINCHTIVCGGACGSDLIALDVADSLGIDRIMVLPCEPRLFKKNSVTDRPGDWEVLFDKIYEDLKLKNKVKILKYSIEDPDIYKKTNIDILEQAQDVSNDKDDINALVLWEGFSRGENDITELFIRQAEEKKIVINEIITST